MGNVRHFILVDEGSEWVWRHYFIKIRLAWCYFKLKENILTGLKSCGCATDDEMIYFSFQTLLWKRLQSWPFSAIPPKVRATLIGQTALDSTLLSWAKGLSVPTCQKHLCPYPRESMNECTRGKVFPPVLATSEVLGNSKIASHWHRARTKLSSQTRGRRSAQIGSLTVWRLTRRGKRGWALAGPHGGDTR